MARRFDLLIFDWDGTLSDSAQQIVDAMQAAIRGLDLPPRSDQQIRELIGLSLIDGLRTLYPDRAPEVVQDMLHGYRKHWLGPGGGGMAEPPLFAGAMSTLQTLSEQGYPLAIATGKSRIGLQRSFAHHKGVLSLMAATKTADETASKPNPLMLREILQALEIPADRALMIGDTEYDAAMARAIHMPALGVACGVHDAERIVAAGAMAVIESVRELPEWLAAQ
jgi:phosphoglycolate phosphatase